MKEVKCNNCGVFTKNADYCSNCGALISYEKIREKEVETIKEQKLKETIKPSLLDRMKNDDRAFVRLLGYVLYVVWVPFMAIGAFLAWLIAAIAA